MIDIVVLDGELDDEDRLEELDVMLEVGVVDSVPVAVADVAVSAGVAEVDNVVASTQSASHHTHAIASELGSPPAQPLY